MPYVVRGEDADRQAPLGGKARALAALRQANLPIPSWFALTPDAFYASLTPSQQTTLETAQGSKAVRDLVVQVQPAVGVQVEVAAAVRELCPNGELLAVRSSASDEDGAQHSFAGQLDSFLFVPANEILQKV